MKVILPDSVTLRASKMPDRDEYAFSYTETFHDREMLERTVAIVKDALRFQTNIEVGSDGNTAEIKGVVPTAQLGNMMTGEFIGWSTLGNTTLRELLGALVVLASGHAPTPPLIPDVS